MARIIFTLEDGTEIESQLDEGSMAIGRHADNDLVLPSASVSSRHAVIKLKEGEFYLQDLGSTNGTKVNGVQIEDAELDDGDQMSFGDVPAVIHFSNAKPAPIAAKPASAPRFAPPKTPASGPRASTDAPVALPPPAGRRPTPAPVPMGQYQSRSYESEGGGCAAFVLLVVFLVVAFVAGLSIRHYIETKGNLPAEFYHLIMKKVEILKKSDSSDSDKSTPAPAAPPAGTPASPAPASAPAAPAAGGSDMMSK